MKREFILVLLGIISISTLSSLLSGFMQTESDIKHVLLDTVVGKVGAGNFSYWQSKHDGPLLIKLTSLKGDADLYVSDTVRPSYQVDMNNFSSVTCGLDVVYIPNNFPRPIGIGVFGYWSHAVSEYTIQVFLDTSLMQMEEWLALQDSHKTTDKESEARAKERLEPRKTEKQQQPRFLNIFNVLDMIFDMSVL